METKLADFLTYQRSYWSTDNFRPCLINFKIGQNLIGIKISDQIDRANYVTIIPLTNRTSRSASNSEDLCR